MSFKAIFPPIATALEMEREELGPYVLKYLATLGENINRYNFTLGGNPDVTQYAGPNTSLFCERLMEAWMWLEKELFVVPRPGQLNEWAMITRRGRQVLQAQDFNSLQARVSTTRLEPGPDLSPEGEIGLSSRRL